MSDLTLDTENRLIKLDTHIENFGTIAFDSTWQPHSKHTVLVTATVHKIPKLVRMLLPWKIQGKEFQKEVPRENIREFGEHLIAVADDQSQGAADA